MTLDVEIERVKVAALRTEDALRPLRERVRGCCPTCDLGEAYAARVAAQERRLAWLAILLEKRGDCADLARAIRIGAWP